MAKTCPPKLALFPLDKVNENDANSELTNITTAINAAGKITMPNSALNALLHTILILYSVSLVALSHSPFIIAKIVKTITSTTATVVAVRSTSITVSLVKNFISGLFGSYG